MADRQRHSWSIAAVAFLVASFAPARGDGPDLRAGLPPIVYVSRTPPAGADAGQVPGLGPHGTFWRGSGVLMERSPDGRTRALVARDRLQDVADPAVSPDGESVVFSGLERPGGRWRLWVVRRAGGDPRCLTCDEPGAEAAADDADPCWWGDSLVFASTRAGGRALYDGSAVTQLWLRAPSGQLWQLTHEPNGALDPCVDPRTRRIVFARWWFNPWVSASASGITREPTLALRPDSVNAWQVVSALLARGTRGAPALADLRLAAGGTVTRRRGMGVQPNVTADGHVLAVAARNTGLAPRPGTLSLQRYGAPPGPGRRLAGAAIGDDAGDPYTESANLAAPAACAPVSLPDGRVLHALDPSGRGDFGLWLLAADGESRELLLDEPGTLELDPDMVMVRPPEATGRGRRISNGSTNARRIHPSTDTTNTFRYLDTDVFAGAGAALRRRDARLHVYRLVSADSVELLHDVLVPRRGRVDLRLPADTPLFEQLTDAAGRALLSTHGPAQVRGFNSGAAGTTSRCTGCHLGHSAARKP